MMKPILVGEINPYGADPRYALYPYPENSAGGRLCWRILGLKPRQYLSIFDRRNLCTGRWTATYAKESATEINREVQEAHSLGDGAPVVILLGSKVCKAFGVDFTPFEVRPPCISRGVCWLAGGAVTLPHPSGRCTLWETVPHAAERARDALWAAGVELP